MWLLNNLSSFVKNVIIVKHNTSAIGKTCPSVVLYCFLKYLRECQFFKEIVIFQKSDPFFVLFQTAITLLILILHWKAMLFWKCLYPYFNFKWLFDVATEVKILLWHTYCWYRVSWSTRENFSYPRHSSSNMMTSSNGNIFRVTCHLRGEFTGPRWIPRT